jgi:hypothetical protein
VSGLFAENTPARFWRLLPDPGESFWARAVAQTAAVLPDAVQAGLAAGQNLSEDLAELVLGEGQFGPGHWELGSAKRFYYRVKPVLPTPVTRGLRRLQGWLAHPSGSLAWPIEDRFVRFQAGVARHVLDELGIPTASFLDFWPRGARFALVLTHDVETGQGQRFAAAVADLEEAMGFRSSFNLVASRYPLDFRLIEDLVGRGFEVGVHGLHHDGRLFSSRAEFSRRAKLINERLRELGACGFRSPLTHRNPEWMQELAIEYDSSFFDTDPYEPIPGGTMSIWPFQLGAFIELPETLVQDHTLRVVLGQRTPRLWLDKLEFIAASRGMALLTTHPDYLREPATLTIYRDFLTELRDRHRYWHALPREVARWWRARASTESPRGLPEAMVAQLTAADPFSVLAAA